MSNKAVSNIRWEEFSDAELLDIGTTTYWRTK